MDPAWTQALEMRRQWLASGLTKGLCGWIAYDDGSALGFIEVSPSELSPVKVSGPSAFVIDCFFAVPPEFYPGRSRGLGAALLAKAKELSDTRGVSLIAEPGLYFPQGMHPDVVGKYLAVHDFRRGHGPLRVYGQKELFKHEPVRWTYRPSQGDHLTMDIFWNPICLYRLLWLLWMREIGDEFGHQIVLREHEVGQIKVPRLLGAPPFGVFINGQRMDVGYPPDKAAARNAVLQAISRSI
jgi:hypothetical protein